jgi:hypothetical protein
MVVLPPDTAGQTLRAAIAPPAPCQLAEVTRVRGDDEQQTGDRERDACNDPPGLAKPELRDLRGDEPDTSKQDEQESDFGEPHAGVMAESNNAIDANDSASVLHRRVWTGDLAPVCPVAKVNVPDDLPHRRH